MVELMDMSEYFCGNGGLHKKYFNNAGYKGDTETKESSLWAVFVFDFNTNKLDLVWEGKHA